VHLQEHMSSSGISAQTLELAGLRVEKDKDGNILSYVFADLEESAKSPSGRVLRSTPQKAATPAKKKKEKKEQAPAAVAHKSPTPSRIQWGKVDSFYFADTIGYGVVPSRGFYPLGMGAEEETSRDSLTVDEAQRRQQEELRQRALLCGMCGPDGKGTTQNAKGGKEGEIGVTGAFETRQFDYKKKGATNPLFAPLSEEERLLRLLPQVQVTEGEKEASAAHSVPAVIPASPGRKSKRRSGSITDFQEREKEEEARRSSRSASVDFDTTLGLDKDMSVAALNKELRAIRSSRAVTTGCTCKPLKVDKLSVAKLREELGKRWAAPNSEEAVPDLSALGKTELVGALREKLKDCALCRDNNCICVQEGIECRSDTCECLRHGVRGGHKSCENPFGASMFDSTVVQDYRQKVLGRGAEVCG